LDNESLFLIPAYDITETENANKNIALSIAVNLAKYILKGG
jgi:hypothetical protein